MIEPGKNGCRSGGVAGGAARHVTSRKTGFHLTWILPTTARAAPVSTADRAARPQDIAAPAG